MAQNTQNTKKKLVKISDSTLLNNIQDKLDFYNKECGLKPNYSYKVEEPRSLWLHKESRDKFGNLLSCSPLAFSATTVNIVY